MLIIIRKAIALNEHFAARVRSSRLLKLVTEPSFALSVFHVEAPAEVEDKLPTQNTLTVKLHERLEDLKDIVLTKTLLNGVSAIRFAVGSRATEKRHVDHAFDLIHSQAEQILAENL